MTGRRPEIDALGAFLDGAEVVQGGPGAFRATGRLRPGFAGFEGHFPGRAILAGAFQLEMAAILASMAVPGGWALSEVHHARFRRPLAPGDDLDISVAAGSADGGLVEVKASIVSGENRACQATLVFRGPPGVA